MRMLNVLCIPGLLTLTAAGAAPADQKTAKQSAAAYFEALTRGDVSKANELSAVPFSLDRKKVLTTKAAVKEVHEKILKNKGKRKVPKYSIAQTDRAPKLDRKTFPPYVAYRVTVMIDERKEIVDIYVSKAKRPMVVGFSD